MDPDANDRLDKAAKESITAIENLQDGDLESEVSNVEYYAAIAKAARDKLGDPSITIDTVAASFIASSLASIAHRVMMFQTNVVKVDPRDIRKMMGDDDEPWKKGGDGDGY